MFTTSVNNTSRKPIAAAMLALSSSFGANTVYAQNELILEEVLVTASKRLQSAQSLAESIVAVSGKDLEDAGILDFASLTEALPGVELRNAQPGNGSISVRGVAELNGPNLYGGTGSAVGFYLDEAPLTMAGRFPDMATYDMSRVEVLKGPQGTLYGEGSLAGTVRMISNAPDATELTGSIQGTLSDTNGGDDNWGVDGAVNVPLVKDVLALRLVGSFRDESGYIDRVDFNTGELNEDNANTVESGVLRASLGWTVSDKANLRFTYANSDLEIGGRNISTDEFYNAVSVAEDTQDETDLFNLTFTYATGIGEVVSSTSYIERDVELTNDNGGLTDTVNLFFGAFGVPLVDGVSTDQLINVESFAQEIRLVSDSGGPFNYTAGIFYKDHEFRWVLKGGGTPPVAPGAWETVSQALFGIDISEPLLIDTNATTEQWAVYGELTWDLNDNLSLIVGGRYFEEDRESVSDYGGVFLPLSGGPLPGTAVTEGDDDLFNPRVSLRWHLNDDVMVYATYSEGFRSGGQNDLFVLVPNSSTFYDSETLESIELGIKSDLWDNRLRINAAWYYADWSDLQAVVAEGPGGIGEVVGNFTDAHTSGVDLEVRALLAEGLELSFAGSWLEAETDADGFAPDPSGGDDLPVPEGSRIPRTSEQSAYVALQYTFDVGSLQSVIRTSYSYTGDAVDQIVRQQEVPSYEVVDLRWSVMGDAWRVTLFADNLTDEEIRLDKEPTPDNLTNNSRWNFARPRTIGASARFDF